MYIYFFSKKHFFQKDYRMNKGSHRDEHQPGYEAWRAERNRIDEDRISRQRTAEGNWRREWDNDKVRVTLYKRKITHCLTVTRLDAADCIDVIVAGTCCRRDDEI